MSITSIITAIAAYKVISFLFTFFSLLVMVGIVKGLEKLIYNQMSPAEKSLYNMKKSLARYNRYYGSKR